MVRIDEAGHDDHVRGVDHLRLGLEIAPYRDDFLVFDQDVRVFEVAERAVEGEHDAALQQDSLVPAGSDRAAGGAGLIGGSLAGCFGGREGGSHEPGGARLQKIATLWHGRPPGFTS